ncbi:MAG: hypothetical protein QWI36_03135 [Wolbachia endosymbiont of Tyrophagus putrescentiae]|nr:hypothetical protein [Wolbachia endosymbiont of Tyrophagus putrescentiae]
MDDFWNFFCEIPSEGYEVIGSHCTENECSIYEGNIDPNNIWTFYLTSQDGKVTQKVETSILDFCNSTVRFNIDGKVFLDVNPENCKITEEGSLVINKSVQDSNQTHTFEILIKKA